jgi:hypothetical protein
MQTQDLLSSRGLPSTWTWTWKSRWNSASDGVCAQFWATSSCNVQKSTWLSWNTSKGVKMSDCVWCKSEIIQCVSKSEMIQCVKMSEYIWYKSEMMQEWLCIIQEWDSVHSPGSRTSSVSWSKAMPSLCVLCFNSANLLGTMKTERAISMTFDMHRSGSANEGICWRPGRSLISYINTTCRSGSRQRW